MLEPRKENLQYERSYKAARTHFVW